MLIIVYTFKSFADMFCADDVEWLQLWRSRGAESCLVPFLATLANYDTTSTATHLLLRLLGSVDVYKIRSSSGTEYDDGTIIILLSLIAAGGE